MRPHATLTRGCQRFDFSRPFRRQNLNCTASRRMRGLRTNVGTPPIVPPVHVGETPWVPKLSCLGLHRHLRIPNSAGRAPRVSRGVTLCPRRRRAVPFRPQRGHYQAGCDSEGYFKEPMSGYSGYNPGGLTPRYECGRADPS